MAMPLGDFVEDTSVTFWWSCNDAAGGSDTHSGDTIKIDRDDGTDCTGTSVTVDSADDPDTGLNRVTIDFSDNANYATNHRYVVWGDDATIDGQTVNGHLAEFSIELAALNCQVDVVKWLGTGCATPAVAGVPEVDATHISGDSSTADKIESILTGSGIADDVDLQCRSVTITNDAGSAVALSGTTHGLEVAASAGHAFYVASTGNNGASLYLSSNGSGSAFFCVGGTTGHGIYAQSGANSGAGIRGESQSANGDGMELVGTGIGQDLHLAGVGDVSDGTNALVKDDQATDARMGYLDNINGHTAQTGDSFARLGANGASLSAIPWNSAWDAEIESECTDALTAWGKTGFSLAADQSGVTIGTVNTLTGHTPQTADHTAAIAAIPTNPILDTENGSSFTAIPDMATATGQTTTQAAIAALNDLSEANIRTAVGLAAANLDTQLGDIPTVAEFNARTLVAAQYATAAGQTTTQAAIAALNNLSQADIRTAVGLAAADLDTQLGNIKTDTTAILLDTSTTLDDFVDECEALLKNATYGLAAVKNDTAAILTDTNELQLDWENGGRLDNILDAIAGYIDTEIAAIKAVTDNLPNSGTLTDLASDVTAVKAKTDNLKDSWNDPTAAAVAQAAWTLANAIAGKTPAQAMRYIGAMLAAVCSGAGTGNEEYLDFAGDPAVDVTADIQGNRPAVTYHDP